MIVITGIFLMSSFLLFVISDNLVSALAHFSRKAKLSAFFVGVIVLSLGTSIPELINSAVSSFEGVGELGFGTIMGSSITNIFFVLAISAIVSPITRLTRNETKEGVLVLLGTVLFLVLTIYGGGLSRLDGVFLIAAFFFFHYIFRRREVLHRGELVFKEVEIDLVLIPLLLLGVFTAGIVVVNSTILLTEEIGMSLTIFGLTALSLSTSLPELASSITASFKKNSKMAVGTILGSNLTNLLLIGGVMALINPVNIAMDSVFAFSAVFVLFASALFILMTFSDRNINKKDGLILLLFYVIYIFGLNFIA
ncbi:MAG: sodium:calcium antiporter [Nanoarchaeota archaeon]|nr:sodium:calcium antiporter [Nanoarchaeota archaeon]